VSESTTIHHLWDGTKKHEGQTSRYKMETLFFSKKTASDLHSASTVEYTESNMTDDNRDRETWIAFGNQPNITLASKWNTFLHTKHNAFAARHILLSMYAPTKLRNEHWNQVASFFRTIRRPAKKKVETRVVPAWIHARSAASSD
jgi:hypothetical protein